MRQTLFTRQPLSYRVGSSTLRVQTKFVTAVALIGCGALLLLYVLVPSSRTTDNHHSLSPSHANSLRFQHLLAKPSSYPDHLDLGSSTIIQKDLVPVTRDDGVRGPCHKEYNSTYPLTQSLLNTKRGLTRYRIAVVADMDTDSKDTQNSDTWNSYLKKGYLEVSLDQSFVQVWWDADIIKLSSHLSYGGRGLELSELVVFNGKVYSVDDRTGVVYNVNTDTGKLVPWVMLTDGDGNSEKGFKSEWATVRDGLLYVGGLGKEWTTSTGELINHNPQWIKTIDPEGHVNNYDWTNNYVKLREAVDIHFPGYMIHEAASWSNVRHEWMFLPRRASPDSYDEKTDEHLGTNLMLTATSDFSKVTPAHVGELLPTHGFSSFKFVPNTDDEIIVALKSEEVEGVTGAYIMAFTKQGKILMKETKIGDYKYEGIEFI